MKLIIVLTLLGLGYGFGRYAESNHYRSIRRREQLYSKLLLIPERRLPEYPHVPQSALVSGNVVISVDYFKRFIASIRNLVGGRVTTYESLLDRGRREAILRMKEAAHRKGAEAVFNVKLETASISKGQGDSIGSIEVYAYGTAIIPPRQLDDGKAYVGL